MPTNLERYQWFDVLYQIPPAAVSWSFPGTISLTVSQ